MKAILEFELPEDNEQHEMAVRALDYYSALWDIYRELRQEWKYGREVIKTDRVYKRFFEILDENDVNIF